MPSRFVQEDCKDLSIDRLVAQVRTALADNDRAGLFLLARYAAPRVVSNSWRDSGHVGLQNELARLLTEARNKLKDTRPNPLYGRAQALMEKATKMRTDARSRHMAERKYAFQSANGVGWDG